MNKSIKAEIRVLNTENKQLEQCLNTKDVLDLNQLTHNGTCHVSVASVSD